MEIRRSLRENTWADAARAVDQLKKNMGRPVEKEPTTIGIAKEIFLGDLKRRSLADVTIYKYRILFKQLEAFALRKGWRYVAEFDLDGVTEFAASWGEGPLAGKLKLQRLRTWFTFCKEREWVSDNPARKLHLPKPKDKPTLPFSSGEVVGIFATLDGKYAQHAGRQNAQRLKAFVLLLRYSGLRIGDAVGSRKERIQDGKIFLYTQKTGTPVRCPLPLKSGVNPAVFHRIWPKSVTFS
jgi:integrase